MIVAAQMDTDNTKTKTTAKEIIQKYFLEIHKMNLPSLEDFGRFRDICHDNDSFQLITNKKEYTFYQLPIELEGSKNVNIFKFSTYVDIDPSTFYDMIHDPHYRSEWDKNMAQGFNMVQITGYSDIGAFLAHFPVLMAAKRYTIAQRNWIANEEENEYMIFNHSVDDMKNADEIYKNKNSKIDHKNHVRMDSYISGYYMKKENEGTRFIYLTCCDIKFAIGQSLLSYITKKFMPIQVSRIIDNAKKYDAWKKSQTEEEKKKRIWRDNYEHPISESSPEFQKLLEEKLSEHYG